MRLLAASWETSVAFGSLKTRVLEVQPLLVVVALGRYS